MVFLGADHRGFELKERLKKRLVDEGFDIQDLGNDHLDENDDYVVIAEKVAKAVVEDSIASFQNDKQDGQKNYGIILCGSGAGVDMVANKINGVRSALVFDVPRAIQAREHEDANVISLPADTLDEESSFEIAKAFLTTQFSGEQRHIRRLEEMKKVEKN